MNEYLRYFNLNIEVPALEQSCYLAEELILSNFGVAGDYITSEGTYEGTSPETTKTFLKYNLLLHPYPQMHQLYEGIRKSFRSIVPHDPHYVQCWLNVYNENEYIDWHGHWPEEKRVWHGYYTVRGEGSITSYRFPHLDHQIDVSNKVDQLVIGPSAGDQHRTYPWKGNGKRITIAFDIVPEDFCFFELNHWLPI